MKTPMLPILAVTTLAAAASAQTVPVKRATASENISLGFNWSRATDCFDGYPGAPADAAADGFTLDLRAAAAGNVFLTASYSDLRSTGFNAAPDISTYSIGFGGKLAAGNGNIEASYAYRNVDVDTEGDFDQHLIKLGYSLDVGNGFNVTLAVVEIINTEDLLDNVTAPVLSINYGTGKGLGAEVSFSTENTLLGLQDGGATTSIGVRYGF